MTNGKIKTYIGFAIKSGAVIWGLDNILSGCEKSKLILYDNTLSSTGVRKLTNHINKVNAECIKLPPEYSLSDITGRDNVKLIAVTNANLADAIRQNI